MNDGLKKKKDALVDSNKVEEDIMENENALLNGGAAWDKGSKGTVKKRKPAKTESKPKKRKMEKLVGWGEVTDLESEMNVRDWLLENKQEDNNPDGSHTINRGLCQSAPVKTERMKQLELSFKTETGRMFAMESVDEVVAKPRMSKEEKLKRAAVGTMKMTAQTSYNLGMG